jgi:hypothetical protein
MFIAERAVGGRTARSMRGDRLKNVLLVAPDGRVFRVQIERMGAATPRGQPMMDHGSGLSDQPEQVTALRKLS